MIDEAFPGDAARMVQIQRAAYPEYVEDATALQWFPANQLDAPVRASTGFVAYMEGVPVGYTALWRVQERKYRFDLLVHPARRRCGIGSALFDALAKPVEGFGARTLQARVRSDATNGLTFLQCRGFVATQRMEGYELDLRSFDLVSLPGVRGMTEDFSVIALSDARVKNCQWREHLLALLSAAQADWPDPDPDPSTAPSPVPMATFERLLSTATRPDAFFIAADRGRYIGLSCLHSLGTAVHPEYRGRGIATFLHSRSLLKAQQDGLTRVTRPSANPAMQAVFRKLGYRPTLTEIRMVLRLDSTEEPSLFKYRKPANSAEGA